MPLLSPPPTIKLPLHPLTTPKSSLNPHSLSLPLRRLPAAHAVLTSSVGFPPSPPLSQQTITINHLLLLNITACAAAISASWVFLSAIPTILAFKRAAESLEKLLDVTTKELPDTMAAIRLSGMEISDLTMELSDLGQEIGQGVRSSTRAVRVAEERLRSLARMAPTASTQGPVSPRSEMDGPVLATTARRLREGIVKGRAVLGFIFSITLFSRRALRFWLLAAKNLSAVIRRSCAKLLKVEVIIRQDTST